MEKPNECIVYSGLPLLLLLEEEYKGSAYAGIARLIATPSRLASGSIAFAAK
jgi:hypothetical protein